MKEYPEQSIVPFREKEKNEKQEGTSLDISRYTALSNWTDPEIIHQTAIIARSKPGRIKEIMNLLQTNSHAATKMISTDFDTQVIYELMRRGIDPHQASRSAFSI